MVKDLNPVHSGPPPSDLTNVNGTLYFVASDGGGAGRHGNELWKTDGTEAGTVMVKDILPGEGGSGPADLTNVNSTLYFTANDATNGVELWKSDGTAAGTMMVEDINRGEDGSFPSFLTNVNGTLYFAASDGTDGVQLWKSDGTANGTAMLTDLGGGRVSRPSV